MIFCYKYGENTYRLLVNWTAPDGKSKIFDNILRHMKHRHEVDVEPYRVEAEKMEQVVDKLYNIIYIMTDEYDAAPFNPTLAGQMTGQIAELQMYIEDFGKSAENEVSLLLYDLYNAVLDKLRETVGLYLEENRYRSKHETRKRRKESSTEVVEEKLMSYEFEDVLLTMTDISHMLDCLSETQRTRLVKHIFLKYTFQEIADSENVAYQSVQESVVSALKKIKQRLS